MNKNFKSRKTICLLKLSSNSSLPLGIISFLNYITSRSPPLDQNVSASPIETSRLGVGPVTTISPAEDEVARSETESPSEEKNKLPNAEL